MNPRTVNTTESDINLRSTILYVDDDPDDQEFFIQSVQGIYPEIDCYAAENGMEALDVLQKIPAPKCIFIDINMPLMNGIELLQILKGVPTYSKIPSFIISTSVSVSDALTVKKLGAVDCIIKPTSQKELMNLLKNTLSAIEL